MTDPRKPMPPDLARASRRAAALFTHWRREGNEEGELAVLTELGNDTGEWTMLVCALLNIGCKMIEAGRRYREDEYLAYVVREAALDEVSVDG